MLNVIKEALRIKHDKLNNELLHLIESAEADLVLSGVNVENKTALIKRAIILYCKANFGIQNQDYERLILAYNSLKRHLALSLIYKKGDDD